MRYDKKDVTIKRDGRVLKPTGPRAMQMKSAIKAQESETITLLKEQIKDLMKIVAENKTANIVPQGYSAEEVDKEINKAVEVAVVETEKKTQEIISDLKEELAYVKEEFRKYRSKYNEEAFQELQNKVTSLKVRLESKEEIIESFKVATGSSNINEIIESIKNKVDVLVNSKFEGNEFVEDPDRPVIETKFIDPLDNQEASDFEQHVSVEEEEVAVQGDTITSKVNKLKDILGK